MGHKEVCILQVKIKLHIKFQHKIVDYNKNVAWQSQSWLIMARLW